MYNLQKSNLQKRFLLFLIFCMGSRLLLAFIAKNLPEKFLKIMGYFYIIIAISFMYLFITNKRKTGAETFGEKIWWTKLRPIHSILYFLFAFFAITGNKNAWKFLFLDVIFGLASFIYFHSNNGDFKKIL